MKFLNHPGAGISEDVVGPNAHRYPEQRMLARKGDLHFFHGRAIDGEFWRPDIFAQSVSRVMFSQLPHLSSLGCTQTYGVISRCSVNFIMWTGGL